MISTTSGGTILSQAGSPDCSFSQRLRRMDAQVVRIVVGDLLDEFVVDQVAKERAKIGRDLEIVSP